MQLGGNKYVYKVKVWADQMDGTMSSMVFWAADVPRLPTLNLGEDIGNHAHPDDGTRGFGKIVKRSAGGRNIVCEHAIMAKL